MQPEHLFNALRLMMNRTRRVPLVIRAGGRLIEVESLGIEALPGGRYVVTLTPSEALRVVDAPSLKVTDINNGRR
jgi:hypothetical protein